MVIFLSLSPLVRFLDSLPKCEQSSRIDRSFRSGRYGNCARGALAAFTTSSTTSVCAAGEAVRALIYGIKCMTKIEDQEALARVRRVGLRNGIVLKPLSGDFAVGFVRSEGEIGNLSDDAIAQRLIELARIHADQVQLTRPLDQLKPTRMTPLQRLDEANADIASARKVETQKTKLTEEQRRWIIKYGNGAGLDFANEDIAKKAKSDE
jgi:hypothetical protein